MSRTSTSRNKPPDPPGSQAEAEFSSHTDTDKPATNTFRDSLQRFQYEAPTTRQRRRSLRAPPRSAVVDLAEDACLPATPNPPKSQRKAPSRALQPASPNAASPAAATKKRKREPSKYAPPSKYAHLHPLTDILAPNLICVFVGTNPGVRTATSGHAYAHPSNLFWKLLHSSGCTDRQCRPEEDVDMPRLYGMGNTNIVARPSRDAAELSKAEMSAGAPILDEKFRKCRPEAVCIVGKGIWEAIWRYKHGKNPGKEEFRWGWQDREENMGKDEGWDGARVYVTSSTSGLSASLKPAEKEAIWKPFGEWVKQRRKERAAAGHAESAENGGETAAA